jgi:hypothetical protein
MKLLISVLLQYFCIFSVTIAYSQIETLQFKESTASIGVLAGYSESIVRSGSSSYDYSHIMNKEKFTDHFRGYFFGLSYNKQLQDNNNFATFTGEVVLQKLPTYYESYIFGTYLRYDHEPQRPPTLIKNTISNYMLSVNAMYNFNMFNTGFAFNLGGSIGYAFNKYIITTAIVDSNVLDQVNEGNFTPLEPYQIGEEAKFTYIGNPNVNQLRFGFIFGLNYNLKIQNTEIEPFVRYNIAASNNTKAQYYEDYLHSLQAGIAVRFPL